MSPLTSEVRITKARLYRSGETGGDMVEVRCFSVCVGRSGGGLSLLPGWGVALGSGEWPVRLLHQHLG